MDYKIAANTTKNTINIYTGYKSYSSTMDELIASCDRIFAMDITNPDEATLALQDHFDALSQLTDTDIKFMQSNRIMQWCSFICCALLEKGARMQIIDE